MLCNYKPVPLSKAFVCNNFLGTSGRRISPGLALQVLIFSQFKIMLNVIEDALHLSNYPCERIDGDSETRSRQASIDRFMAGKSANTKLHPSTTCPRFSQAVV